MRATKRRQLLAGAAAAAPLVAALPRPALAQPRPLRVGILAPRAGVAGTAGEVGLKGTEFAVEKINAAGGVAGRRVELVIEEETNPRETVERARRLALQERVDVIQGVLSSGVSLALGPVLEESRILSVFWDGTTQDGVNETMPRPRWVFRSTDNECEAVMGSLMAIKHFRGQFVTVAGINPDYSYGRNNWAAFIAFLKRFGIEHRVVAEQWPRVGGMDLTANVAALKSAAPDLVFSSMLFADLPVFMRQAHAAGLLEGRKWIFPAAGFQHTSLKKEFTPPGMIFGHNTLYFADPQAMPLAQEFVRWYHERTRDWPHWEADRAFFAMEAWRRGVEKAVGAKGGGSWPSQAEIAEAIRGIQVVSLGGPGRMREDAIAEQTFVQGVTTHDPRYDFPILDPAKLDRIDGAKLQKPPGGDFWRWIGEAKFDL
jgi:branched-chain amino acid transport system substrate-binding protein